MPRSVSFEVSDDLGAFIDERISKGYVSSVDEALNAGLHMFKANEDKRDALYAALDEGEASGDAGPLDMEEIIREARAMSRRAA